jgi:hypothetical protein
MQGQNEVLEGHEESSRDYGGPNSRANRVEASGERNRNSQSLSRRNPSRIKELQHVVCAGTDGPCGPNFVNDPAKMFEIAS